MKRLCLRNRRVLRVAVIVAAALLTPAVQALEADVRLKWFSTSSVLPDHDIQRVQSHTPLQDHSADMRIMFKHQWGRVQLLMDHSTVLFSGDTAALDAGRDVSLDQTVSEDSRRWVDLTWHIAEGNRHSSFHRLDRLAAQWQPGDWSITLGRQALSWGSGIVFQPMDLFSPFSPTVVDRDYKAGDDLLLIDRLLANGQDLQLLHVVRRDEDRDVTSRVSSTALKWHGYLGAVEFEAVAARHYDEPVAALSMRMPVGTALLRSDVVASRDLQGDWRVSGLLNADYSFTLGQRNTYVFAEYFHNGWGISELAAPLQLPEELQMRLERGELFNLMRNYLALGATFEWHPLVNQNLTVISNLHDSSSLLQVQFSYSPGDNQSLQAGWIEPLGRAGDEFGGVPLLPAADGGLVTTGGAGRAYLRWVYYL